MSVDDKPGEKPNTEKHPIALEPADDNFDRKAFVDNVGDGVVKLVNEARKKKGLPPLEP